MPETEDKIRMNKISGAEDKSHQSFSGSPSVNISPYNPMEYKLRLWSPDQLFISHFHFSDR